MDKTIIELFEQGLGLREISKATGVPVAEARKEVMKKYYIDSRRRKPCLDEDTVRRFAETHTVAELCDEFGLKECNMYLYLRKHNICAKKRSRIGEGSKERATEILEIAKNSDCETYAELGKKLLKETEARSKM